MTKELYADYLLSDHWAEVKSRFKKERCELCNSDEQVDLHHFSYAFYREELKHVASLCRKCHLATHHDAYGNLLPQQNPWVKLLIWAIRANPHGCEAQFLRSRLNS